MLQQYANVLLFLVMGISVSIIAFNLAAALRPGSKDPKNSEVYECGMDPVGTPWVSPNIRFYTIALVFVAFDVEALYIFPWAVELRKLGFAGFIEMMTFVGILFIGLLFAWKKGALKWE
jgi:NAD(P)H-quinone oxidoreductase subunit 3